MAKIKLAADFSDFLKLCLRNEVRFMVIGAKSGSAFHHHGRAEAHGIEEALGMALGQAHTAT